MTVLMDFNTEIVRLLVLLRVLIIPYLRKPLAVIVGKLKHMQEKT